MYLMGGLWDRSYVNGSLCAVTELNSFLAMLNSSCLFFIFLIFSARFRQLCANLLTCQKNRRYAITETYASIS